MFLSRVHDAIIPKTNSESRLGELVIHRKTMDKLLGRASSNSDTVSALPEPEKGSSCWEKSGLLEAVPR